MIVIQDKREKNPYDLGFYGCIDKVVGQTLECGDYSIKDMEKIFVIERKARVTELANNLVKYRERFEKQLSKMSKLKYKYLLLEFSLEDLFKYPKGSGLPKKIISKIRTNGKFLYKVLSELEKKYNIEIIFAENRVNAEKEVVKILNYVYQTEKRSS